MLYSNIIFQTSAYYKETISILSFYLSFIGLVWFMVIQQYFSYIIASVLLVEENLNFCIL